MWNTHKIAKELRNGYKKAICKTITFRIMAMLTTFIVAWSLTGKLMVSLEITLIVNFIKMILYFLHELAWERV